MTFRLRYAAVSDIGRSARTTRTPGTPARISWSPTAWAAPRAATSRRRSRQPAARSTPGPARSDLLRRWPAPSTARTTGSPSSSRRTRPSRHGHHRDRGAVRRRPLGVRPPRRLPRLPVARRRAGSSPTTTPGCRASSTTAGSPRRRRHPLAPLPAPQGARRRHDNDPDLDSIQPGDRILLCSDGVSGVVDDGRMADVLAIGTPTTPRSSWSSRRSRRQHRQHHLRRRRRGRRGRAARRARSRCSSARPPT